MNTTIIDIDGLEIYVAENVSFEIRDTGCLIINKVSLTNVTIGQQVRDAISQAGSLMKVKTIDGVQLFNSNVSLNKVEYSNRDHGMVEIITLNINN
jgi:hypothetical protein